MSLKLVSDAASNIRVGRGEAPGPDVMIAESNHRIANNLTLMAGLLRLQATAIAKEGRSLSADEVCLLLEEAGGRIKMVSKLHRLLAVSGQEALLDIGQYLRDVAETAIGSMSLAGNVTLVVRSAASCQVPSGQAMLIGFVVGEAVANAVKYAHPTGIKGRIELACHSQPQGALLVIISDDGVGLPEGFDPCRDGGLGLRMIRGLADQMGATLTFDSHGVGLTLRLLVPPPLAAMS